MSRQLEAINKSEISKHFANLRKWDYKVFNFSGNKKIKFGNFKSFIDIFIVGKSKIFFIEIKMINTKDTFDDSQKDTKSKLVDASKINPLVYYFIVNENNYKEIAEKIYMNDANKLSSLKEFVL